MGDEEMTTEAPAETAPTDVAEKAPVALPEGPCQQCDTAYEQGHADGTASAQQCETVHCGHCQEETLDCCEDELACGFYIANCKTHELWCGDEGVEPICYEHEWQASSAFAALVADCESGTAPANFDPCSYIAHVLVGESTWHSFLGCK